MAAAIELVLVAIHLEPSPRAVALGPAMLASALDRAFGADVRTVVLDLFLQDGVAHCADRILASGPRFVGFSMYLWNRTLALAIAGELKRRDPGLVVFAGGSEATADLPGVLADPAMDFVLPGEGEELIVTAMEHLRQGLPLAELQALVAVEAAPVKDLATLQSPFLDGTLRVGKDSGQLWELSRGCPFTCDFCFESRGASGTRRIPMERVQAELELFEAAGVSQVFVLDPTFNHHRKQAKEVLRLIRRTAPAIHFFFEIRSEFLDRELAGLFAAVKCTLQIGLQSSSGAVLRNIGRTLDREDFRARILLLHEAGATYGFDLIYGLPGDSLEGFLASLDFALGLVPNHLDLFRLSVLPGTRLMATAPGFGLEHQAQNPYQVTGSPTFSGADLDRAGRIAASCDRFYNQGKAVPWFGLVQGALELPPSAIFARFADLLDTRAGDDTQALQRDCVRDLLQAGGHRPAMATVAADLITYFGHAADLAESALRDPEPAPGGPLRLNPHTRLAAFNHDPATLLENLCAGITELEDLSYVLPDQPGQVALYWRNGETALRSLTDPQAQALERLRTGQEPSADDPELAAFLESLVAEGLVLRG
jgi:hypothetical protein